MRRRLVPEDGGYPDKLRALPRPPEEITVSGDLEVAGTRVAIIGARDATMEAVEFVGAVVREVVAHGGVIVSGGAVGIDGAAHAAALEVGGPTWVVAPTGEEACFPTEHRALYERVEASARGVMIWPFAAQTTASQGNFFLRNAVLVALSDVVVIAQAGWRSGSLNAAKAARLLDRPVWAVAGSPWQRGFEGGAALVHEGHARIVLSAATVAKEIFPAQRPLDLGLVTSPRVRGTPAGLSARAEAILGVLNDKPQHLEIIAEKSSVLLYLTSNELLTLVLGNVVVEGPPGWFRRALS